MAEGRTENPGKSTLFWVVLIVISLYLFKIYLREPHLRYVEVCYLPHKVANFFWVDVWGAVVPNDNATLLKHSMDLKKFFFTCTSTTKHWSVLRIGEQRPGAEP
jgi:hypothetical protein